MFVFPIAHYYEITHYHDKQWLLQFCAPSKRVLIVQFYSTDSIEMVEIFHLKEKCGGIYFLGFFGIGVCALRNVEFGSDVRSCSDPSPLG